MMAIKFRRLVKNFLDVPRWVGAESIKLQWQSLGTLMRSFQSTATVSETFDQAVSRLQLTADQLQHVQKLYYRNFLIYFLLMICMICYGLYLFYSHYYKASIVSLSAISVLASFAFREHFWYTQMRCKQLGMNFSTWLRAVIDGDRS